MGRREIAKVERATVRAAEARAALHLAIRQAREAGETMPTIAGAAGLTKQRIAQILAKEAK